MKILITGGAGFIGSRLALYLQELDSRNEITIFDNFYDGSKLDSGNLKCFGSYLNLKNFSGQVVCGDICSHSDLRLIEGVRYDVIFHLAAISDTRVENENVVFRNNINPFLYFVDLAKKTKAKLVYASSAAVYGNSKERLLKVGMENPCTPYAYSKYAMDTRTNFLLKSNSDIQIVGLRYFNVYGYGEFSKGKTSSTVLQFASKLLNGEKPFIFRGSDTIYRDFIYIDDVVQCTVKAALSQTSGVFNVGSGEARSFMDVFDLIQSKLGTDVEPNYIDNPFESGYQFYTKADISETQAYLDFKPNFSLENGISDYLNLLTKK